ncbi:sensor histidine kinase [Spongiimicrobium salis]|uniref:sensor histidine kinase n=1 Tax=Spongiimicrobium salis TaxID=1667022 RepID=UPI00374DB1BE
MEPTNYTKKLLQHLFVLLALCFIMATLFAIPRWGAMNFELFVMDFLQVALGIFLFLGPAIYVNVYVLIPKYLVPKNYLKYAFFLTSLILCWGAFIGVVEPWTDEHWFHESQESKTTVLSGIMVMAFILLISTLLNLSYRWFIQLSRIKQIENDRLQLELSSLKSQISPHFFFNTLNNLYALSLEKSDKTSEVILKLSEMMRYTIYDCKEPRVPIKSEVTYIENFIALQKVRHHQRGQINFEKEIESPNTQIAPMILIIFVENAFKHGFDLLKKEAFLDIDLKVSGKRLKFQIRNNFKIDHELNTPGIGLENVKRRLSLLYPTTHILKISSKKNLFIVDLELQLR